MRSALGTMVTTQAKAKERDDAAVAAASLANSDRGGIAAKTNYQAPAFKRRSILAQSNEASVAGRTLLG